MNRKQFINKLVKLVERDISDARKKAKKAVDPEASEPDDSKGKKKAAPKKPAASAAKKVATNKTTAKKPAKPRKPRAKVDPFDKEFEKGFSNLTKEPPKTEPTKPPEDTIKRHLSRPSFYSTPPPLPTGKKKAPVQMPQPVASTTPPPPAFGPPTGNYPSLGSLAGQEKDRPEPPPTPAGGPKKPHIAGYPELPDLGDPNKPQPPPKPSVKGYPELPDLGDPNKPQPPPLPPKKPHVAGYPELPDFGKKGNKKPSWSLSKALKGDDEIELNPDDVKMISRGKKQAPKPPKSPKLPKKAGGKEVELGDDDFQMVAPPKGPIEKGKGKAPKPPKKKASPEGEKDAGPIPGYAPSPRINPAAMHAASRPGKKTFDKWRVGNNVSLGKAGRAKVVDKIGNRFYLQHENGNKYVFVPFEGLYRIK